MCTVSIKVDSDKVRRINPNLTDNKNIEHWIQHFVDELIDSLYADEHRNVSPNAHSDSEMRTILQERIRRAEAGKEKLISNSDVFAQIEKRYGL